MYCRPHCCRCFNYLVIQVKIRQKMDWRRENPVKKIPEWNLVIWQKYDRAITKFSRYPNFLEDLRSAEQIRWSTSWSSADLTAATAADTSCSVVRKSIIWPTGEARGRNSELRSVHGQVLCHEQNRVPVSTHLYFVVCIVNTDTTAMRP